MTILKSLSMATTGVVFIALGTVGAAQAITLVAPNDLANTEGNAMSGSPLFSGNSIQVRHQQVFGASQFNSLPGPQYINQLSFRIDKYGSPFTANIPNIKINLSTTKSSPDGLSTTFSDNIGANNTLVFDGSILLTSASAGPAEGPNNFDINFNFKTPFLYDPAQGNLLLDIKNYAQANNNIPYLDSTSKSGDSTSQIGFGGSNVDTATTGNASTLGLVTQFTTTGAGPTPPPTTPVPPPTTPLPPPTTPEPPPMSPEPPTEIPFEFSPNLGLLILGAWGGIVMLKTKVQKRKVLEVGSLKTNDIQAESV